MSLDALRVLALAYKVNGELEEENLTFFGNVENGLQVFRRFSLLRFVVEDVHDNLLRHVQSLREVQMLVVEYFVATLNGTLHSLRVGHVLTFTLDNFVSTMSHIYFINKFIGQSDA